jgi:hypothetical protein
MNRGVFLPAAAPLAPAVAAVAAAIAGRAAAPLRFDF